MSLRLDCLFGLFKSNVRGPQLPLRLAGRPFEFYLERASRPGAGPGIQMRTPLAYSPSATRPATARTDLLNLQLSLSAMLRNPASGQRITRVGLIFADVFEGHEGLFGLMFDQGFAGAEPPIFTRVPREGAAVFLGAIARHRGSPEDVALETSFTSAHELSHLFNLWHVGAPSFLATSDALAPPFGLAAYRYVAEHTAFLRNPDRPEVFPGGTPFGVRGTLGPPDTDPRNQRLPDQAQLHISTSLSEFWHFEPLELTVRLSPIGPRTKASPLVLPDTMDPGYDGFDIWITEPDGIQRRYRPTARFCTNTGAVRVTTARPFERDIPIFGQAGGYTFRKSGVHRVCVTVRVGDGETLRSNDVEIAVRKARPGSSQYDRLRSALCARVTAQLLFYKSAGTTRQVSASMDRVRGLAAPDARAALRYAGGRALASSASRQARREAYKLLNSALDSGRLTNHQTRRAAECLHNRLT